MIFRVKEQSTFLFKNFGPELYNDFLIVDNAWGDKKDDSKKIDNNNYNINNKIQSGAVEEEVHGCHVDFLKLCARKKVPFFQWWKIHYFKSLFYRTSEAIILIYFTIEDVF